ncbi:MAG: AAA family ATPase [Candidatus Micrarchaeia archaeon]
MHSTYLKVMDELTSHIAGKKDTLELLFLSIIANGHALLEGVPGVAKTTMTKVLASIIDADFKRIQGTSDLDPKDILGYTYLEDNTVKVMKGPIFTNILLLDELNRIPPKTMSSFLEALEEKQVSLGGVDIQIPRPFTAFATQNPLRVEGTEPIPKVMADRFLMRIEVDYPSMEEEAEMLRIKEREEKMVVKKIVGINDIIAMQDQSKSIIIPDNVVKYITALVSATRTDIHVIMGASPRADIAFMMCGKAKALIEGRKEVTIDDIRFLAKPILSHRIAVRATGGIGVNGIIDGLLASVKA